MHRTFVISAALALLPSLAAARPYVGVPQLDGQQNTLQIRFVKYTGGSSGRMVVDVRNAGVKSARFAAKGLFFVPEGDPDKAPQRLGAAGPFEVNGDDDTKDGKDSLWLAPGATRRLKLQVFCLDSHRSSPGVSQKFQVAAKRLPKTLRNQIEDGAQDFVRQHKGKSSANGAIQSHVWKTRNKKWIKLEGERINEKSTTRQQVERGRQNNTRNQQQQVFFE